MNCEIEIKKKVDWIKELLAKSGAKGIVYGNSGGKDCTLVSYLAKLATDNVTGLIMPCESSRNYGIDREHALLIAKQKNIHTIEVDLTETKQALRKAVVSEVGDCEMAYANMNPRLRMATLYSYAYKHGYLVAGTGNKSEAMMGYFTKWGDGAYDFNPIADLTVAEVYELLRYLNAPAEIIDKAPSAGLYEGQTDEQEIGLSYAEIDDYLLYGKGEAATVEKIKRIIDRTAHKRSGINNYKG